MDSWQQGRHRAGWQIPITAQLLVLIRTIFLLFVNLCMLAHNKSAFIKKT